MIVGGVRNSAVAPQSFRSPNDKSEIKDFQAFVFYPRNVVRNCELAKRDIKLKFIKIKDKMKLWYPEITPQNNLVNSKSRSSKVCGWFILATMCLTPFSSGRPQQILFSEIPIVFSAVAESKTPWQVIKRLALPISSSSCSRSPP